MWQNSIKDLDLIFISIQAFIPYLKYIDKTYSLKNSNLENLHTIIAKTTSNYKSFYTPISASAISEVSGISRATCIRKLDKIVKLGLLVKETKTKKYHINQIASERTKNIMNKDYFYFNFI